MRLFGLIGYPLTHSFSEAYFNNKFEKEKITDCTYINFPLPNAQQFTTLQTEYVDLIGCNVTRPYKESILSYVDEHSPLVQQIGACNCIHFKNRKTIAYNTDVVGFKTSFLQKKQSHHTKALILGTGGASQAVQYVLKELHIDYQLVSRNKTACTIVYENITPEILQTFTIIIQTTPLGTFPKMNELPDIPYKALTPQHYCFDLVYNPIETMFLQYAKRQGAITQNGYDMLCIQAEESWKIWNR